MSHYKMHRGWMDNRVFRSAPYSKREAWVWLIEHAVWQEEYKVLNPNGEVALSRGQLSYSVGYLSKAWKRPKNWVFRVLKLFKSCSMIRTETRTGQNVITICNYEQYQLTKEEDRTQSETEIERQQNDDRTNTKKEKKDNNIKGGKYAFSGSVIRLTWDHFTKWQVSFPAIPDLRAELQGLDDYYSGNLSDKEKKDWFFRTSGALKKANAKYLQQESEKVVPLHKLSDAEYNDRFNDFVTEDPALSRGGLEQ